MLKRVIPVLFTGFMLTGCPEEKQDWLQDYGLMLITVCPGSYADPVVIYTDMMDGTVRRTESVTGTSPCWGTNTRTSSTVYIKKCLQGQVYRSAQNDCQGTGAAPDWGAQRFQFCPTSDRACDMTAMGNYGTIYVADPTKSPAAISCANDITSGKKWMLVSEIGLYHIDMLINSDGMFAFPDIPKGNTQIIWTDFASDVAIGNTYYLDSVQGAVYGVTELKSAFHYVLCATQSTL